MPPTRLNGLTRLFGRLEYVKIKKRHAFLPTPDDGLIDYAARFTECSSGFSCITQSGKRKCVKSAANPSKYKNTD